MLNIIAILISLVVLILIIAPFFSGRGGALTPSSSISSPEVLEQLKKSILHRYLEDEKAVSAQNLSEKAWNRRRNFLVHRYVDTVRRLDYLKQIRGIGEEK